MAGYFVQFLARNCELLIKDVVRDCVDGVRRSRTEVYRFAFTVNPLAIFPGQTGRISLLSVESVIARRCFQIVQVLLNEQACVSSLTVYVFAFDVDGDWLSSGLFHLSGEGVCPLIQTVDKFRVIAVHFAVMAKVLNVALSYEMFAPFAFLSLLVHGLLVAEVLLGLRSPLLVLLLLLLDTRSTATDKSGCEVGCTIAGSTANDCARQDVTEQRAGLLGHFCGHNFSGWVCRILNLVTKEGGRQFP